MAMLEVVLLGAGALRVEQVEHRVVASERGCHEAATSCDGAHRGARPDVEDLGCGGVGMADLGHVDAAEVGTLSVVVWKYGW